METAEAKKIIQLLAEGVNPTTGEIFQENNLYQNDQIVCALYIAVESLEHMEKIEKRRRVLPNNTGKRWTKTEDNELLSKFDSGIPLNELANAHQRTVGAIKSRLIIHGRIKLYV